MKCEHKNVQDIPVGDRCLDCGTIRQEGHPWPDDEGNEVDFDGSLDSDYSNAMNALDAIVDDGTITQETYEVIRKGIGP